MIAKLNREPARAQQALQTEPYHQWTLPDGTVWTAFHRLGDAGYLMRFPDRADFEMSVDGLTVSAWPTAGTSQGTMDHLYLNQVLPLAMSRQGKLVLHASAVALGGQAVIFMGESGRGKSTLAAAFALRDARFLTDDGMHIMWKDSHCWVHPSHPSIRLWADSEEALIPQGLDRAPAVGYTDKARLLAGPSLPHCEQPQKLGPIYLLGDGSADQVQFTPVTPAEGLMELVKNTFLLDIEEQAMLAWHFDEITRLCQAAPIYRLDYPKDYAALPAVCAAIAAHAHSLQP